GLLPARPRETHARRRVLPVDAALRTLARDLRVDDRVVPRRVPRGPAVRDLADLRRAARRDAERAPAVARTAPHSRGYGVAPAREARRAGSADRVLRRS